MEANTEYKAKPLDCQSDEVTVQLESRASQSSFSWINFPLWPKQANEFISARPSGPVFSFSMQGKKENTLFENVAELKVA